MFRRGQVYQLWSRDDGVETTCELLVVEVLRRECRLLVLASDLNSRVLPREGTFLLEKDTLDLFRRLA